MQLGKFKISDDSISFDACKAGGPGGQHVNKTSSAVVLRFKLEDCGLDEHILHRFRKKFSNRINSEHEVVIKAMNHRSQLKNRHDAIERLTKMVEEASIKPKYRVATKPTKGSKKRRVDNKKKRADVKKSRGKVSF